MKELCAVIEAILFVSGDPVRVEDLAHSMNMTASAFRARAARW